MNSNLQRKKLIDKIAIVAILVVIAGGYLLATYSSTGAHDGKDIEINMTAFQWGFEPQSVEVTLGDRVSLNVRSIDVTHGIAIDEFQVNEVLFPNETIRVEFVADKVGVYNFYCSVACGAGHNDQKGNLIVKDRSVE